MLRKVTALALVVFLILPACGFAKSKPNSVQPLQDDGKTFCTAWSINEAEGLWATAAHCAAHALTLEEDATILGQPAVVIYMGYPATDIAVMQSEATAPAIKLSTTAPEIEDELKIVGYGYGITRITTKGSMAARRIPIKHPSTGYYIVSDILDITVAGGNSGSAVVNKSGQVVGLLWGGFTESPHSLSVSYEGTIRALLPFVG